MAVAERPPIIREIVTHLISIMRRAHFLDAMNERRGVEKSRVRELAGLAWCLEEAAASYPHEYSVALERARRER
jgi:hypothetical protein